MKSLWRRLARQASLLRQDPYLSVCDPLVNEGDKEGTSVDAGLCANAISGSQLDLAVR